MVTVEAGGALRAQIPPETVLSGIETVGEALQQLHLPPDVALIIMVNGRIAHWATRLQDGDVLQLLPTIGGGCAQQNPNHFA
jgi:molybdopterin converting factor small subunit